MILFSVLKMHMGGLSARLEHTAVPTTWGWSVATTGEWSVHWKLEGLGTTNTPGHQQHLDNVQKTTFQFAGWKDFQSQP